nr:leucine-rich repeat protein [Butyrivibrio sp. AE2032]
MRKSLKLFCSVLAAVMMLSVFSVVAFADSSGPQTYNWNIDSDGIMTINIPASGRRFSFFQDEDLCAAIPEAKVIKFDISDYYAETEGLYISGSGLDFKDVDILVYSGSAKHIYDCNLYSFNGVKSISFSDNITVEYIYLRYMDMSSIDSFGSIKPKELIVWNCTELTEVNIPSGIKYISFRNCKNLSKVAIPDSVTSLEYSAFRDCEALKSIVLPDSVESIDSYAFMDSGLESIKIPSKVAEISNGTFANCTKLRSITIPETVERVSPSAFSGCSALKNVYYEGTEAQWNKIEVDPSGKTLKEVFNNATIHFNGEVLTGWVKDGDFWMYYKEDGNPVKNDWLQLNGKWYHFNEEGYMAFDFTKIGNDTYYFKTSGEMVTGWLNQGKYWYYLNTNGKMATGWKSIGGKWYFFQNDPADKPSGIMLTGWQKIDGKWYYMDSVNGDMKTGWQPIGGKWYYLKSDGVMVTGWLQLGNTWYYLKSDGAMVTGWQQIGGKWYYFNANGDMKTGWLQLGSKWYYLKSSGEMATGKLEIGGKTYEFSNSGVWKG